MPQLRLPNFLTLFAWLLSAACLSTQNQAGQEILYPGEAFAKLDTFESVNLEDADKLYKKTDYQGAYAAYKAFSFEFPKSKALPYVLLRQGRCLHKLDKRNAAIKAYQDVVDYFPDDIPYAAAALYYIGECHGQNGEEEKQTAVWARLVKDDGYVTQPNSGTALVHLSAVMEKLGKFDEATDYQWRTAVAFLKTNPSAAQAARRAVLFHYAVRNPNHEKLKEFYIAASGFDGSGSNTDKPEDDARYWFNTLELVFGSTAETRENTANYWAAKMGDRFTENDTLRLLWFNVALIHEKNQANWLACMEKQFAAKPASIARIVEWCRLYSADPKFRTAFFVKHTASLLPSMKPAQLMDLFHQLVHPVHMADEAQMVFRAIRTDSLTDPELQRYAILAAGQKGEEEVIRLISRIKDPLLATKTRFDYYFGRRAGNRSFAEKALAEIPALLKAPQYAGGLIWTKADLLHELGRLDEAIEAYRAANVQPDSTWAITRCLIKLKQYDQAIKNVSELESLGGPVAAEASLAIANIYKASGDKAREVNQLRTILRRYPKTTQSAAAHDRLESYGVALVGGQAEAKK